MAKIIHPVAGAIALLTIQGFRVSTALSELIAGAVKIALLGLNMRDGLRLTGRLRRRPA